MIRSQKGQATVELALTLPILILLIFGIIDFGRIFHASLTLDHAGREAARVASLGAADSEIVSRAKEAASSLNVNNIKVSASPVKQNRTSGTYVTVNLAYSIDFSIPLFNPFTIQNKTVMRVE